MISAHELCVELGGREVVHGVTLDFGTGWTAVVGPNGAGKSSLLRALAGLLPASAGEVRLDGRRLREWPSRERARRVSWLAQHPDTSGDLTVRDVVLLGRIPHRGLLAPPGADDEAAVEAALRATDSLAWAHRRLSALSGGERQRVLLARALAVQSPVLLLDEATTHLDPWHQVELVRLLRAWAAEHTVVSVLHDLASALQADRLVILDAGRVAAAGAPGDESLHQQLSAVFRGAIEARQIDGRWAVLQRMPL